MNNFFRNRYGFDKLNLMLIVVSLLFIFNKYLMFVAILLLAYMIFRATSRNFTRRQMELRKFEIFFSKVNAFLDRIFRPIVRFIQKKKYNKEQKKIYKYVKCRYCGKKLRIPKNKGKLKVTCPECKNQFITKT